ncbi:MAG: hypothetical protein ACRCXT_21335 [Paraclostridium sp.]
MRKIFKEVKCEHCGHIYDTAIYLAPGDCGDEPWYDDIDNCPECGK